MRVAGLRGARRVRRVAESVQIARRLVVAVRALVIGRDATASHLLPAVALYRSCHGALLRDTLCRGGHAPEDVLRRALYHSCGF